MTINNKIFFNSDKYAFTTMMSKLPYPDPDYVRLKYLYCGICGGDYSLYLGRRNNYPATRGHEFVAKVIDTGSNVTDIRVGDYVVSDFNFRCGECNYCKKGYSHLCIMNDIQKFSNRAFAQYANVHYSYLLAVNDIGILPRACFIEPLSCVLHAIDMMSVNYDDRILINGGGSIGTLFCLYFCRVKGLKNVYVLEKNTSRLNNLIRCYDVYDGSNNSILTYDIVIECTNSIEGMREALNISHVGGQLCIMSHLYGLNTSFIYEIICKKELRPIFPLRNGEKENLFRAYSIIKDFWRDSDDILFEIYDSVEEAFNHKASSNYNKQIIKIRHDLD